jgi:uroporphyrinogen decarboxylase
MSPAQFEDIILPCDAAVVAAVKGAGGYCIKHIDGDVRKIMDQLVGTGLDCLGPLEPVPGMELDRILARYPGRICVMGNVSVDLLSSGTREQVIDETQRLLATVSARGPHIMSSGNTIASSVKPENFLAMVETTKRYGTYPIDGSVR